ncbi:MAG: CoA ester lyase [Acidimicrobiia bacterium]|nr:CoA ester lyase [Acidimicrobiia bacterium]
MASDEQQQRMVGGRVRRSAHFVPGANEKMLTKSLALAADALVLDLEDAVTPDRKDEARGVVSGWLADVDFGRQERVVRMNPLDSPWWRADLEATMVNPPDSYLVPKIRGPEDVVQIDQVISDLERKHGHPAGGVRLLVLGTETAEGLLRIRDIPTASARVDALTWGAEDLSAALGARRNRDEHGELLEVFRYARIMCLVAAVAARVQPLDTVYVDINNHEGLRADCVEGAAMGFTGKITIHPNQVDVVNDVFTPNEVEVAEAQELLDAFEDNRKAGRMAFAFKGQMVDVPHLQRAQRILAVAAAIAAS